MKVWGFTEPVRHDKVFGNWTLNQIGFFIIVLGVSYLEGLRRPLTLWHAYIVISKASHNKRFDNVSINQIVEATLI